jgi:hypothetical protein
MTVRLDGRAVSRGLAQAALMPAAALAVHQLRYWLAYGNGASVALARQGHSYLHSVVPWIVLLLAVAAGGFLRALGRAFAGNTSAARYTLSLGALWLLCTGALLAIFSVQELLEGLFASGHAGGLAAVFANGAWWAIPAAACVGLVVAAVLHGARWAVRAVAARVTRSRIRTRVPRPAWPPLVSLAPPAALAGGSSGRGPPR